VIAIYAGDSDHTGSASAAVAVTLQPMFTSLLNPTSITLNGNRNGNVSITLTPTTTFPLAVMLNCGNLPQGMTCSFSPSLVPVGAGVTTSTVTIQYAATAGQTRKHAALLTIPTFPWKSIPSVLGFALLVLLVMPRRRRSEVLACTLVLPTTMVIMSCGGGKTPTPASTVQATTTMLTSSSTPTGQLGAAVTFTVSVTSGSGTPTGVVILQDGSSVLGSQSLSNGGATFSESNLSLGSNALTAIYDGDNTQAGSSASLTETVNLTSNINVIGTDTACDTVSAPLSVIVQ
jgi:hypothetical protein